MKRTATSENHPTDFQRESLDLVNRLLPLSSSGFYLVNADMQHRGVVLRNIDVAAERDYLRKFQELDPLSPARFAGTGTRVACIDEQLSESELLGSAYYRKFMRQLNHRHVADMFLRRGNDIIAVLTMLRSPELGYFTASELTLLRELQPFLEYALNAVYLPRRYRERDSVQQQYALTDRELDVVEMIVAGASNKLIAQELHLSLATVKTHLQHVFKKLGVSSRTGVSALILGSLEA
jgi:ATP/maltotriose-dependent transcriptional regulator MalT